MPAENKSVNQEEFHEKAFTHTCAGKGSKDLCLKERYEREIKKLMSFVPELEEGKLVVLDAGCNTGVVSKKIIDKGHEVYGIDVSGIALEKAREKGVKTFKSSLQEKLPYKDSFFDMVFSSSVIEHLYDPEFFLRECNRVLKKDGRILLFTPNLASLPNRLRLLLGLYPRNTAPVLDWPNGGHIRVTTFKALKKVLERNHFRVLEQASTAVYLLPCSKRRGPSSELLARVFPSLGERIIVLAQKV